MQFLPFSRNGPVLHDPGTSRWDRNANLPATAPGESRVPVDTTAPSLLPRFLPEQPVVRQSVLSSYRPMPPSPGFRWGAVATLRTWNPRLTHSQARNLAHHSCNAGSEHRPSDIEGLSNFLRSTLH